ncbi:MAG: tyrosine-protein phosphatase [Chloroflexi bacterium]|nr:tyrosine-protein phosphatase [Chloroflexota bacterium]
MWLYQNLPQESYRPQWVIEGVLARSQRPGYPVDKPSPAKVQEWTDAVRQMGIRSVLCVMDDAQIAHYGHMNLDGGGLFGYYRSLGLAVEHIPAEDYRTPPLSDKELDAAWDAFQRLEKPILIHCSAGRDRTGAALDHILWQLSENHTNQL